MTGEQTFYETINTVIWDLPFDLAQGGELVEPFVIWCLKFVISLRAGGRFIRVRVLIYEKTPAQSRCCQ